MSVFLWDHRLTYVSLPKAACTSLKHMFFEIENGFAFRAFQANGRAQHIHNAAYPSRPFARLPHGRIAGHLRLAVLRDPVSRFLSGYSNRVLHHRELAPERIAPEHRRQGASPDPDLAEFLDKLEIYRAASPSIRHHTEPMVGFLGPDPGYYGGLYDISRLEDFRRRLEEVLGRPVEIPHRQTGGPKLGPEALSAAQRQRLERIYAEDYRLYGRFL